MKNVSNFVVKTETTDSLGYKIKAVSTKTAGPGGCVVIHTEDEKVFSVFKRKEDYLVPEIPPTVVHIPIYQAPPIQPQNAEVGTNTELNTACSCTQTSPAETTPTPSEPGNTPIPPEPGNNNTPPQGKPSTPPEQGKPPTPPEQGTSCTKKPEQKFESSPRDPEYSGIISELSTSQEFFKFFEWQRKSSHTSTKRTVVKSYSEFLTETDSCSCSSVESSSSACWCERSNPKIGSIILELNRVPDTTNDVQILSGLELQDSDTSAPEFQ